MPSPATTAGAGRALAVLLLGVALALLTPAGAAQATNFGSTVCGGTPRNCVSLADNYFHAWYPEGTLGNQIPGMDTAFQQAMTAYDRTTHLTVVKRQYRTLDVLVTDASYGNNGIYAWVECLPGSAISGSHPNQRCDRQKLRLNGEYAYTLNASRRLSLACHEIGHTVGLRHTQNSESCMNTAEWVTSLSEEDRIHINRTY